MTTRPTLKMAQLFKVTTDPGPIRQSIFRGHEPQDYEWNGEPFWLSCKGHNVYVSLRGDLITIETSRRGKAAEEPFDETTVLLPKTRKRAKTTG